jgi:ribonuclease D
MTTRKRRGGRRRPSPRDRADATAEGGRLAQVEHPLVPQGEAPILTEQGPLDEFLAHIEARGAFCFDTEFIGEDSYEPHLCLVQLATAERIALVDPQADLDIDGIWRLVGDPAVVTVVHAAQADMEFVVRAGHAPHNLLDTQVAAAFAGLPYPISLQRLAQIALGVHMGKGLTFTRWDRRPLSGDQRAYAADDVRLGMALHAELSERLEASGFLGWAYEASLERCDPERYGFDLEAQLARLKGTRRLKTAEQRAALRELVLARDRIARAEDQPVRATMKDEVLVAICESPPKNAEALAALRFMPRPIAARWGEEILAAVARGHASPEETRRGKRQRPDSPAEEFAQERFWVALQHECLRRGISPALVGNRGQVQDWYRAAVSGDDAEEDILASGWRRELLGAWAEAFLRENPIPAWPGD